MVTAEDTLAHDRAVREGCGLVDRSDRGKLVLSGPEAREFLQGQVSNDVEALAPGTGCYAALLTHKGKMLADLRVLAFERGLWLDTERLALQELFNVLHRTKLGRAVEIEKRTLQRGLLSLVGPAAATVAGVAPLAEHAHVLAQIGGVAVRVVGTDLGLDVVCDAEDAPVVAASLAAAGSLPVPEAAAEVLRVERGRPRYGVDLDDSVIPQEAGLNARAVSFTKGCYVGQETVARLHYRGKPNRHLRGLRLSAPVATGTPLRLGEREVGRVGSTVVSPVHGPIALALVRREAAPGDAVAVGEDGTAEVVALPFH